MTTTYLLIDDEAQSDAPAEGYAEQLTAATAGALKVDTFKPAAIQDVLEFVAMSKPAGLLVDVAFTNALTSDRTPLPYDGIALAQQIRTLQTRGLRQGGASLPEFPLVRFSKADVIREYVSGDTTSEDLFDWKIDKAVIIDNAKAVAERLLSLAKDYPAVSEYASNEKSDEALARLIGCEPDFLPRIDARALLGLKRPDAPAHVLSRYIIGPMLGRAGPLVNESLLAIRLGIDRAQSPDWHALLENISSARYSGVFSQGYRRWWMALVVDWWSSQIESEKALVRLDVSGRVGAIIQKTGMKNLVAFTEDPDSPGTKYWYRCIRSKRPVDPACGFPLMPEWGQETWHDVDYLCLEEAKRHPTDPRLAPSERTRAIKLRESGVRA